MELEIISEKDNPFFNRKEVDFVLKFPREKTPSRNVARETIAERFNYKKKMVVLDHLKPATGKAEAVGYAKLYKTEEEAKKHERDYILLRNKLIEKKEED